MMSNNSLIQQERRNLLIDATITAIAEYGLSKLTLAKISAIAGMSAGTVNFHFDSKESLLLETLNFVAEEFDLGIERAVKEAGADPSKRLAAIVDASLDPEITEHRKMAVWFAFDSESWAREDYQRICGSRDRENFKLILNLCEQIIRQKNKQQVMSARAVANAISGLTEELWKEILFAGESYDRDDARQICQSFLASVFPWCYQMPKQPSEDITMSDAITISKATRDDLQQTAVLFDQYRQFYKEQADIDLAKNYLEERMNTDTSVIFLAKDSQGKALGFTQLYPTLCSVEAKPIWVLYDLFVESSVRNQGIGRALMNRALVMAKKSGASRIDLETAIDNTSAQGLYESLGYQRDTEFYKYSLEV